MSMSPRDVDFVYRQLRLARIHALAQGNVEVGSYLFNAMSRMNKNLAFDPLLPTLLDEIEVNLSSSPCSSGKDFARALLCLGTEVQADILPRLAKVMEEFSRLRWDTLDLQGATDLVDFLQGVLGRLYGPIGRPKENTPEIEGALRSLRRTEEVLCGVRSRLQLDKDANVRNMSQDLWDLFQGSEKDYG